MTNSSVRKTQREYFAEIREILDAQGKADLVEFVDGRVAQLDKKNTAERKPTPKQVENEGFGADIVAFMESGKAYQSADLAKSVPSVVAAGLSAARVTGILGQLRKAGKVSYETVKGKGYWSLA